MTRFAPVMFLIAIFLCFSATMVADKVEAIVTIRTAIVAGMCVIAGVVMMRTKPENCAKCGRGRVIHCNAAPHPWPWPDDDSLLVHSHVFTTSAPDKAEPDQLTSEITPQQRSRPDVGEKRKLRSQRMANLRRNALKKGYR